MSERFETWFKCLEEDEQGFYYNLRDFIATNDLTSGFYERFLAECKNIVAIMKQSVEERKNLSKKLKDIDKKIPEASNIDEVARLDSEFHLELARAAGNKEAVEEWERKLKDKRGVHYRIWESIGRKSNHYEALRSAHAKIRTEIGREGDEAKNAALNAIWRHFVVVLFHCAKRPPRKSSVDEKRKTHSGSGTKVTSTD